MTLQLFPGPPAVSADRLAGRQQHQLVRDELPRVRAAALAWRNGVAGLLAGLVGFGLIKGRTDIGELAAPYDAVVGCLLLAALLSGAAAALLLLRAAHGRPAATRLQRPEPQADASIDHSETMRSAQALSSGVALSLTCAALLCAAVAVTWYGPAKNKPRIEVLTTDGPRCGEVVRLASGRLTLKSASGEIEVDLRSAVGLRAVDACPGVSP